jgi:hypothetical protein
VELKLIDSRDACEFNAHVTLDVEQVSSIAQELLAQDQLFRGAHMDHALASIIATAWK